MVAITLLLTTHYTVTTHYTETTHYNSGHTLPQRPHTMPGVLTIVLSLAGMARAMGRNEKLGASELCEVTNYFISLHTHERTESFQTSFYSYFLGDC